MNGRVTGVFTMVVGREPASMDSAGASARAIGGSVRASEVAIGTFHPYAGTREAGGIAVYTQRLAEALSERTPTFLYTAEGAVHERLAAAPLEVVGIPAASPPLASALSGALPTGVPHVLERLPVHAGLFADGVRGHVEANVDVLVVHDFVDEILLSNLLAVPTVRVQHGLQTVGPGGVLRETLARSTATLANSRNSAREIEAKLGYAPDGIVPPGVDADRFHPDADPAFHPESTAVLYVGRLLEKKGIYDLVEAVATASVDATLHVVGRGEVEAVRRRAADLGVADAVRLHGTVPHSELPGYYAACDVFCNPSHYESFGMVTLEAMACGAAVVATDLDAAGEYLRPGETALVVPPGDGDRLADRIETLAASPSLRADLGAAGREVARRYSWDASAAKLEAVCATVATG